MPLADFGQVNYSGSAMIDAGTKRSLASFDANEINHVGEWDDARHAEQSQLGRVVVLGGLKQLVRERPYTSTSSGPAWAKPWRMPWPARAVSCSGS